jgi:uncharacterized protein (DUF2141 family)
VGAADEVKPVTISGRVAGASGTHPISVALWRADHFLEYPFKGTTIRPGRPAEFSFSVPPGDWALSAFEDLNDNGVLDVGMFGPKEPNGFWRPFTGRRKPAFKEVAFAVTRDTSAIEIQLKK